MKATLLISESQLIWMKSSGFISSYEILQSNALFLRSLQWPDGYYIVRARIEVPREFVNDSLFVAEYCPGDRGYQMYGYYNDFKWEEAVEEKAEMPVAVDTSTIQRRVFIRRS